MDNASDNHRPLDGRVAIVTGASRGIGAATAHAYAAAGAAVALAARDGSRLEALAGDIESAGGRAIAVPTDVTDPAAAVEDFDGSYAANLRGTFLCMKFEIPAMLASGGGAIVNMASTAGLEAVSGLASYVATKHGIVGLSKVAALDYAAQGIRVNVVAPGPILTERLEAAGEEAQQMAAKAMPMQRIGTTAEVSSTVVWLSSDASSFITGTTLPIDGGKLAGTPAFSVTGAGTTPPGQAERGAAA